jgi:hypothetical protein
MQGGYANLEAISREREEEEEEYLDEWRRLGIVVHVRDFHPFTR